MELGQFRVEPGQLRTVGNDTGQRAQSVRETMQPMSDGPGTGGLASLEELGQLGPEWRQAGEGMAGALEIDGDQLLAASETYRETEDSNTSASTTGGGGGG